jgi:uncharacterized damage-inducible protein DinB
MNSARIIVEAIRDVLTQGQTLLRALDDDTYARKLPVAFNASVGEHYRHSLDHFKSFFDSLDAAEVNYDHRQREARLETDRTYALGVTQQWLDVCASLNEALMAKPMLVRCKVSYRATQSPVATSTVGREAMYSVAHAVHHYALIGVMCRFMEVTLPEGFGVAPSTLQHQQTLQAAA